MRSSSILSLATRYIAPILGLLSLIALYRGHNLPGGGFIGGLIAASMIILFALANGWNHTMRRFSIDPLKFIAIGLIIAALSGFPALFLNEPFMTGLWLPELYAPIIGKIKLGTPLLFDIGVYFAVIGFTLKCAHTLGQES